MSIKKSSAPRALTVHLKKTRSLSEKSQQWLRRHFNDPYVQQAQAQGWRSRAAFKLIQLDDKFHFLKPGYRVVDLGAAPGGWTQVAGQRISTASKKGYIVGIDLLPMDPLPGAHILQGDFFDSDLQEQLKNLLQGAPHVVLSDMAASTTGHTGTDHLRTIALAESAFQFAKQVLKPGGTFVAKVFQGGTDQDLLKQLKENFTLIKHVKPAASRKESPEMYVLAFGFKAQ